MSTEPAAALKTLFNNIAHMFYGLSLLAVAGIEWRLHPDLGLPTWLAAATGYLLAALTLCLLVWDAADGFRTLLADKHRLSAALLAGIYLSVTVLAIHAFPALVLRR
jgi:hypothetical protein